MHIYVYACRSLCSASERHFIVYPKEAQNHFHRLLHELFPPGGMTCPSLPSLFDPLSLAISILILFFKKNTNTSFSNVFVFYLFVFFLFIIQLTKAKKGL